MNTDPEASFRQFSDFIEARMAELKIPGVAVGVIAGDQEFTNAFGVTSVNHPLTVDADTYFQIGSITKTYTGTTIMRLVEAGELNLEAPIRTYLPEFRVADSDVTEQATVQHLLTHTAGWHDLSFLETGDGDDALTLAVDALAETPQVTAPGKYFNYNNSAFSVAGRVIEAVTKQTYESAVSELVISPLGTRQSFFPEEIITRAVSVGHDLPPDSPEGDPIVMEPWALPRSVNPAGGLAASLNDQLQYARLYLGDGTVDGERILSQESLRQLLWPIGPGGTTPFEVVDRVGVSWMLEDRAGMRIAAHLGGTTGQQSNFIIVPDQGFAMAILTNANSGAILGVEAEDWALEHFLALPAPDRSPVVLSPEQREDYVGVYQMPLDSGTLRIIEKDGGLHLGLAQPGVDGIMVESPLEFVGDDLATFQYTGLTVFTDFIREDGDVAWIRFVGRTYPRTQETP
jgi:CubicO group peptidase (beta-lactamase class C family)